jgi:hypothetical protein
VNTSRYIHEWFDDSTLQENLVVVAWSGESSKVLNSRVNPNHWLLSTCVYRFPSVQNSTILKVVGEIYFGVKSLEAPEPRVNLDRGSRVEGGPLISKNFGSLVVWEKWLAEFESQS